LWGVYYGIDSVLVTANGGDVDLLLGVQIPSVDTFGATVPLKSIKTKRNRPKSSNMQTPLEQRKSKPYMHYIYSIPELNHLSLTSKK
jgi:hypothetical protein